MTNRIGTILAGLLIWSPSAQAQQSHEHRGGDRQASEVMRDGMTCMMDGAMMDGAMMGDGMKNRMNGSMMGDEGMGRGMMGAHRLTPAKLLDMREALDLTEDQVARLETTQKSLAELGSEKMRVARGAHEAAALELAADDPDIKAYESALSAAMDSMVQWHVGVAQGAIEARSILTDDQRSLVDSGMTMMRHMMEGVSDENSTRAGHTHGSTD